MPGAQGGGRLSGLGKLDPIISEFDTEEEAEAYDRWFRAKVEASLADPSPGVPHDEVMARIDRIISEAAARKC